MLKNTIFMNLVYVVVSVPKRHNKIQADFPPETSKNNLSLWQKH